MYGLSICQWLWTTITHYLIVYSFLRSVECRCMYMIHPYYLRQKGSPGSVNFRDVQIVHKFTERKTPKLYFEVTIFFNVKQMYRRRYESRRSPLPKLHEENKIYVLWNARVYLSHCRNSCAKLLSRAKFYWNRAIGCWVVAKKNDF